MLFRSDGAFWQEQADRLWNFSPIRMICSSLRSLIEASYYLDRLNRPVMVQSTVNLVKRVRKSSRTVKDLDFGENTRP